jgi:hypothetical protein
MMLIWQVISSIMRRQWRLLVLVLLS